MKFQDSDLAGYGWSAHFAAQIDPEQDADATPARVVAVHRSGLLVAAPGLEASTPAFRADPDNEESAATVGDWLLLDPESGRPLRLLERASLFKRRAAGTGLRLQLIAANVDTLFIVSSCNADFNLARLERYLALAREAGAAPVIVLTKADLADAPEDYARAAARLGVGVAVELVDAREAAGVETLSHWLGRGQTAALLGSSGVGKSTLVNALSGADRAATQGVREDDDKGRHTTTARQLHRLANGAWLLDTPGMRELRLTDVGAGIEEVFADLGELATACRFADCRHEAEPGCAVREAIESGAVTPERLERWRKLSAEDAFNNASLQERRRRDRAFGKMVKQASKRRRERDRF